MINITTIYGIRAVGYLAGQPEDRFVPIREISDHLEIPFQYLTKLLQKLQNGGIINSRRGNTGGVILAKPADEITMADVLMILEPDFIQYKCLLHESGNENEQCCLFSNYWHEIQKQINHLMSTTTVKTISTEVVDNRKNKTMPNSGKNIKL